MKNGWRELGPGAALIVVLTVVTYIPAIRNGFVFDDTQFVTDNRLVRASDGLYRFWFTAEALSYYPLTESLWWGEWRLWGGHAAGYHVVNVLLHADNAVLVWMILRRLRIPGAWLASLLFAVHPVNVATVAWIAEQKNTVSMLLGALAVLLYLRFLEDGRRDWYRRSLAAFLLALLSKTAVVMLPFVLVGCVWWLRRQVRMRDILDSLAFFALSLVMGLVSIWFEYRYDMEGHAIRAVGFTSRLAAAGGVPWFYVYKALLPANLMVIYPQWKVEASAWSSYVPGAILVSAFLLSWSKRDTWGRAVLFGLGYFLVMLFPVLGFFDQGWYQYSLVADHWQYYAIIAPIALVIAGGELLCRRIGERGRHVRVVASLALVIALGATAWKHELIYADDETLWRDNLSKNPAAGLHHLLGCALQVEGKLDEAISEFGQALRMDPGRAATHCNLGNALMQTGKPDEAMRQWEEALALKPDFVLAHYNLGLALAQQGKLAAAISHWEEALRIRPDYAEAHYNLGVALEQTGKVGEAIDHYEQALRYKPDYTMARSKLKRLGILR